MKPTPAHLAIWVRLNAPKWAKGLELPVCSDIHSIINRRAGLNQGRDRKKNALYLMALCIRNAKASRESVTKRLLEIANSEHPTNPMPRRAFFKRTANRIQRNR